MTAPSLQEPDFYAWTQQKIRQFKTGRQANVDFVYQISYILIILKRGELEL